jgi:hypothetical protein
MRPKVRTAPHKKAARLAQLPALIKDSRRRAQAQCGILRMDISSHLPRYLIRWTTCMIFSLVSALVIGATGSEWILLPKRAAAFWEGHKKSSAQFQKICCEEPEKPRTRSCRAQELSRSCAQWRGQERRRCIETGPDGANKDRSLRER